MAINFKTFFEGIKIKAKSILTSDTKGELEVSDSTGKLYYHDGLTRSPVVTESHTATLTNKTIDADNNTVSNLEVDNLKAGVLNTSVTLAGASDTQIPSALAVKTYVDTGLAHQNEAVEITYDNSISGLTATNVQDAIDQVEARVDIAESDINAVEAALLAHINQTIDAHDASAISNIPSGNLAATDVQSALNELQSDIDTRATQASLNAHINQLTDAHDASAISVIPTVDLTSTNVQSALEELQSEIVANASAANAALQAHLDDTIDAHDASAISVIPSGNLAADDVQEALVELQLDVDTRTTNTAFNAHTGASSGVHGVTGNVVGTTDSQTLTNKTINADLNTITNIDNNDIKANANIERSKIASVGGPAANTLVANDNLGALTETLGVKYFTTPNILQLSEDTTLRLTTQAKFRTDFLEDATTTGTDATLATLTNSAVRLTNPSLVSVLLIPTGSPGDHLLIRNATGNSIIIKNGNGSDAGILTGTDADITLANNALLFLVYDNTPNKWYVIGGTGSGSGAANITIKDEGTNLTTTPSSINFVGAGVTATAVGNDVTVTINGGGVATSAIDNNFSINDNIDPTKQINFDVRGTANSVTTFRTDPVGNSIIEFPNTPATILLGNNTTQTVTNKTIVAAQNTIVTSPSGNLTSTELNSALSELQQHIDSIDPRSNEFLTQTFDTAVLADFTQTGLELVTTPGIRGTKAARLIHQAATTYSFKQTKTVDNKFKGKNLTASISIRSTALTANVTLLVRDETNNATLTSQQITTGSGTFTASITNGSANITVADLVAYNNLQVGDSVTGTGIPTGTVVISKTAPNTATLSANATVTNASASLKMSALPAIQRFSFNIPDNCASLSYTVSALPEAGLPETYVDDIVIELTQQALQSASITVPKAVENEYIGTISSTGTFTTPQSFIQSITKNGTGDYTVNFIAGRFTTAPSVQITPMLVGGSTGFASIVNSPTASGFRYRTNVADAAASIHTLTDMEVHVIVTKQGVDYTNPLTSTESKTIPLTSSVLVTEPDSYLHLSNGTVSGAGNFSFSNISKSVGDAFSANPSTGTITVLKEGLYNISFYCSRTSGLVGAYVLANGVPVIADYGQDVNETYSGSAEVYLQPGNTIVVQNPSSGVGSAGNLFVSFTGKTKILNPSSDQKVEIPTHELRFEGASARGTTDTAIVKFDTLAKIKGDGFTVVNTAANGTVITVKKRGLISIGTSVSTNQTNRSLVITKNQTNLNVITGVASEILAYSSVNATAVISASATGVQVDVGDIIRVNFDGTPTAGVANTFTLSLQEQSVSVALQNVSPFFDNSDSAVRATSSNGFGTTNTQVRRYNNLPDNFGTDLTYSNDPALGASITINRDGLYSVGFQDLGNAAGANFAIVKNSTTDVAAARLLFISANNTYNGSSIEVYLTKGDVLRVVTATPANAVNDTPNMFYAAKVGKTQGTVDVTPFVQIPQNEVEAIEALTSTTTFGSTNTGVPVLNITKNTNLGIIQVLGSSTEGTSFRVLKECEFTIGASSIAVTANTTLLITRNSTVLTAATPNGIVARNTNIANQNGFVSATFKANVNDVIRIQRDTTNLSTILEVSLTAEAISNSVVSSTQQISSDTIPFVFKSTAIVDADPVGTFNTYTYAANTNTATIATTAPTQSVSSMNVNGVQVFARAYNAASSAASPARVDIKIGKGLKSKQVDAYAALAKATQFSYDYVMQGTTIEYGTLVEYNESTGVLSIDSGRSYTNANTTRVNGQAIGGASPTSGYFVFNAASTPSLVSIPNLQQRIAYLSDVKATNSSGGSSIVTTWTARELNTLVDNTGLVTSLASNQFTLPSGTYRIQATAPFFNCLAGQIRIRNITDSVTPSGLISETNYSSPTSSSVCTIDAEVTISSSKSFQLQYFVNQAQASNGLGVSLNSGEQAVFSQVKITKIK